jgi:putative endonuclease
MQYFVYIIKSVTNGQFYIGQTQNIIQRLEYHNTGRSKYTKNLAPWILFAIKICNSRSDAIKLERKLKNIKSKKLILAFLLKNDFIEY